MGQFSQDSIHITGLIRKENSEDREEKETTKELISEMSDSVNKGTCHQV